jgi:bacteriocin biosynthesis cyclodehydratase domain-containing protein
MANAIRLTPAVAGSTALVGVGPFGERVCAMLAESLPGRVGLHVGADAIPDAFGTGADVVVIALWRPFPELCEQADELSFGGDVPWLPVVMEYPVIRIGPLAVPPGGPCFRCYARRRAQHDLQHESAVALESAYDLDRELGPGGYLPQHARLAAGLARGTLDGLGGHAPGGNHAPKPGAVTTFRLLVNDLRVNHVIACHDCIRCTGRTQVRGSAWLLDLAAALRSRGGAEVGNFEPGLSGLGWRLGAR